MGPVGRTLLRTSLALTSAALAVVVAEGSWSLATGGSLVSFLLDRQTGSLGTLATPGTPGAGGTGGVPLAADDGAPEVVPDLVTEGKWAHNLDPGVAMTMKRNYARVIVDAVATTDRWGQRVRLGPKPEVGALRIVILGDSVAFGFGVADDETFAHHVEGMLADVVPADSPRPVVMTVGCPGWNTRNEVRFLLNHLGRLDPDIVVLMPVENDLDDQFMTNEEGVRGAAFDPVLGPVRPHVCREYWVRLYNQTQKRTPRAEALRRAAHGNLIHSVAYAVETGVTPWSVGRWDEIGGLVEELEARLRANDCRLMVALRSRNPFESLFEELVRTRLPDVPVLTYFETFGDGDHLDGDSHPNGTYTRAGAWCIADRLLDLGWVPGGNREALEPIVPAYADRIAPDRSLEELRATLDEARRVWREFLEPGIDLGTGIGFHQVYGGVGGEGTVGRNVMFALVNDGAPILELVVDRLPADTRVYPLTLTPIFNGVPGAPCEVPAPSGGETRLTLAFEVPAAVHGDEILDVQIDSSNWMMTVVQQRLGLVAYRFVAARFAR